MLRYRKQQKNGFTLVELLAVLTVMAILMAIVISSFKGLGGSSKMRSAVGNLKATLSLTRQWAITHREPSYVVFTDTGTNAYNKYAVYSGTNVIKPWTKFPDGVFFNTDTSLSNNVFDMSTSDFTNETGDVDTLNFVGYKVTGEPIGGATIKQILYVMEAVQPVAGNPPIAGNLDGMARIVIKPVTGLTTVEHDF